MSERPWFKFFPANWLADTALRACKPAARALWMDMLCVMADAEPVGHLLVKGREPSLQDLASIAAQRVDTVKSGITGFFVFH